VASDRKKKKYNNVKIFFSQNRRKQMGVSSLGLNRDQVLLGDKESGKIK
tara:strand:+ start:68 stop:214 length:147 start_codon:yes stop_codon:yes gene_type:complete